MSKSFRPAEQTSTTPAPGAATLADTLCAFDWFSLGDLCGGAQDIDPAYGNAAVQDALLQETDRGPDLAEEEPVLAPAQDPCRPRVSYIDPRWPDMPSVEQIQIPSQVSRTGSDYFHAQDQVGSTEDFETPGDVTANHCEDLAANIQRALDSGLMHPSELHRLGDEDVQEKYAIDYTYRAPILSQLADGAMDAAYIAANFIPGFGLLEAAVTGRDVTFWDLIDLAPGLGKLGKLGKLAGKADDVMDLARVAGKTDELGDLARIGNQASDANRVAPITKAEFLEKRATQNLAQTGSDSVAQLKSIRRNSERLVSGKATASSADTASQVAKTQQNVALGRHNAAGSNFHKLNQDRVKWAQGQGHLQDVRVDPWIKAPAGSSKMWRKPDYGLYDSQGNLSRMLDIKPNKCSANAYDGTPQFMDLFNTTGKMPVPMYYRLPFQ